MPDVDLGGRTGRPNLGQMKTYSRTEERIPHVMKCGECDSKFTIYQNGKKGVIRRMGICAFCAAKKARVEYPNLQVRSLH